MAELRQHGTIPSFLSKLASDPSSGIMGDERDLARRKAQYGKNTKQLPQTASFKESIAQAAREPVWTAITVAAFTSALCGWWADGVSGLVQGLAIIVAAIVIIAVTSAADWMKDSRFVQLQSLIKEESVPAIRGNSGVAQTISVWELVVGDVILLETGSRIPADCLVLESSDLQVIEPSVGEDSGEPQEKSSQSWTLGTTQNQFGDLLTRQYD